MPAPIRLWIEITHHAAFRYGGWAYVRQADGVVVGYAGGERSITVERLALSGLIAALTGLTPGALAVTTAAPLAAQLLRQAIDPLPPGSPDAPTEDLDLRGRLQTLIKGRAVTVETASRKPQTPAAFLAAWAEVGQDKAKGAGRFSAAIPKPNLAKLTLN
jgi:hypothetical protein